MLAKEARKKRRKNTPIGKEKSFLFLFSYRFTVLAHYSTEIAHPLFQTLNLAAAPQYSFLLPAHSVLQEPLATGVDALASEFAHQHSLPYSAPA